MSKVNRAPDLIAEIRDLQKRIRILENSNRLTSASIKSGGLKAYDSTGAEALRVGDFTYGAFQAHGLSSYRPDGSLIFGVGKFDGVGTTFVINDLLGNTVFALDETAANGGLDRPFLPLPFYPTPQSMWASTSAAGFNSLYRAETFVWQTRAAVGFQAAITGTAVGQVQIFVNNVAFGSPTVISSTTPAQFFIDGIVMGAVGTDCFIDIAAGVTSGTGTVVLRPLTAWTRGPAG